MCCCTKTSGEREESTRPSSLGDIPSAEDEDECPIKKEKRKAPLEEDDDWVREAKQEARDLRDAARQFDQHNIDVVAKLLTTGVQTWVQDRIQYLLPRAQGEVPPFAIVATGSFARDEMAPHSDTDVLFLRAEKDAACFGKLKVQLTGPIARKLHDTMGGFTIDDVGSQAYSPEELAIADNKQDRRLLFHHHGGDALYQEFTRLRQDKIMAAQALKNLQIDRNNAWVPFDEAFVSRTNLRHQKAPTIHVKKHLMKLLVFPIGRFADHHDCLKGREPIYLSTSERLEKYCPGELGQRLSGHFKFLQWLRFSLHFERGKEDDDLTPKHQLWPTVQERMEALVEDFCAFDTWVREQSQ